MDSTRFAQLMYSNINHREPKMDDAGFGDEWLDSSKVALLHLCPQKYFWRIELGLIPKGDIIHQSTSAAQYGFALHASLATLYDGSGFDLVTCPCPEMEGCEFCNGKPIKRCLAAFLINYPWNPEDDRDPRTRARGIEIITKYILKWRNDQFDVIAVEVPFTIPFPEFNFIGRIDLIAKWREPEGTGLFPIDHKSSTKYGDTFDAPFKLSIQMGMYIIAVEQVTKQPCNEGEVNCFRVTTNITDDSFKRINTPRTAEEKERAIQEVMSAWDHIKKYRAESFWPRHAPFACTAYFRLCEYYKLCTSGPSAQEEQISTAYERKPWTPLPD